MDPSLVHRKIRYLWWVRGCQQFYDKDSTPAKHKFFCKSQCNRKRGSTASIPHCMFCSSTKRSVHVKSEKKIRPRQEVGTICCSSLHFLFLTSPKTSETERSHGGLKFFSSQIREKRFGLSCGETDDGFSRQKISKGKFPSDQEDGTICCCSSLHFLFLTLRQPEKQKDPTGD